MRLLVVILFLCFVGVTGRRGTTPATSAEHDYFGEHPTKFQRGVLDPWGCTSGWGKREAKKVPESEVEKVKQVKSVKKLKKSGEEAQASTPGWFRSSAAHHERFLFIQDAMDGALE